MIIANIDKYSIEIEGHAQDKRNAEGHDLVCCAVSTLIQSLAMALDSEEYTEYVNTDYEEKGYMLVQCMPLEDKEEVIQALFDMVGNSLRVLETQYPMSLKCI